MRKYLERCKHRCRGFAVRFGILLLAVLAILVVAVNTGEVVTFGIAVERLTEALGAAAADTMAD
jgi:hypothetical protein